MRYLLTLSLVSLSTLVALTACTATSGYVEEPVYTDPLPRTGPPTPGTDVSPLPYAPLYPTSSIPRSGVGDLNAASPSNPTEYPNLSYSSPSYNYDRSHPYNRGGWVNTPGPSGQPMTVWSNDPLPYTPHPAATPGYISSPDNRYNLQSPTYHR